MAVEVARPVSVCVSERWRVSPRDSPLGSSGKAVAGRTKWGLEVKELQAGVLETIGGVHVVKLCGRYGETHLLYSSNKSRETVMVWSRCCVVHEWVIGICRGGFALGSGNKHGLRIGRHDRR